VCCSVLQCVAVCCSVLQRVAVCYRWLSRISLLCCSMLQCVTVCCSVLHYVVAVYCSVRQCAAVCCRVLQLTFNNVSTVLQCVAVCCSVLQCAATDFRECQQAGVAVLGVGKAVTHTFLWRAFLRKSRALSTKTELFYRDTVLYCENLFWGDTHNVLVRRYTALLPRFKLLLPRCTYRSNCVCHSEGCDSRIAIKCSFFLVLAEVQLWGGFG